ncbi:MAG TPA: DUF2079 domain-containing protein [Candidatus Sumerlaeota bacterium]|nr:DUF2079 domain-containing protein [Candidatus Sumerlaeota bacterium]
MAETGKEQPWDAGLRGVIILAVLTTTFISIINIHRFVANYNLHDLFIFESSFWNTIHGRMFWNFYEFGNHLGVHFSPGLILLLPFYAMYQSPLTLLFLQSAAVGASVVPLYLLGRGMIRHSCAAFLICCAYVLYAPTLGAAFSGFHETLFVPPFLFLMLLAHERGEGRLYWFSLVMVLVWKETMGLLILFWGLGLVLRKDTRRKGYMTILAGGLWLLWTFLILMPLLRGIPVSQSLLQYRFPGDIGHSPTEIIRNFFTNPEVFVRHIIKPEKMAYFLKLSAPLLLLPLGSPSALLPALPQLGENLLAARLDGINLMKHYTAPVIPLFFYALLGTLFQFRKHAERLNRVPDKILNLTAILVLAGALVGMLFSEVFPHVILGRRDANERLHYLSPSEMADVREMRLRIPAEADLAVSGHLAKHFARRRVISYVSRSFLLLYPFEHILYYAAKSEQDLFQRHPELEEMIATQYEIVERRGRITHYKRRNVRMPPEQKELYDAVPR